MSLNELLRSQESKTLEFKRDLSSPKGVLRSLVAFANTAGGTLLVGVDDKTRNVRGVTSPLDAQEKLTNVISDGIHPLLSPEMSILPWRKTHLLAAEVFPSSLRPHCVRQEGPEKGVYIRVGASNRKADPTTIAEMGRQIRNESFDEQPLPELSSEAIDFRAASELFADVRKLQPKDLNTLRLATRHQRKTVPTVAGVLLFGADRLMHFPDAWIQAGRFRGTDRTQIMDSARIVSGPVHGIDEALGFIRKHLMVETRVDGLRHSEHWTVPLPAIREALVNAVVHADYSQQGAPIRISIFDDRIEIESPGLLPFGLTVEDIKQGVSKLRNRAMGRVFQEVGLIEQWGSGIQRMINSCQAAGAAPPEFLEIGLHFRVALPLGTRSSPQLDGIDRAILDLLSSGHGYSTAEIADRIGRSARAARSRMVSLIERGLVREVGTGPRDPRKKYVAAGPATR